MVMGQGIAMNTNQHYMWWLAGAEPLLFCELYQPLLYMSYNDTTYEFQTNSGSPQLYKDTYFRRSRITQTVGFRYEY